MDILYSILALANIITFAFFTAIIYFKKPRDIMHQVLAVALLFTIIWTFSHYARYGVFPLALVDRYDQAFYWAKVSHIGASFSLAFSAFFFLIFPDRRERLPALGVSFLFLLILPLIFTVLTLQNLVVQGMEFDAGKYYILPGPAFGAFTLFALSMQATMIIAGFRKLSQLVGLQRLQMKYLLTGCVLVASFGVTGNVVLPLLVKLFPVLEGMRFIYTLAPFYLAFFIYFTAYAVLKHRLMDIELVISRSAGYAGATALGVALYVFIVTFIGNVVQNMVGFDNALVASSAALLIAFLFKPLQSFFQGVVYNKFFAKRFVYQSFLLEASRSIVTIMNLEELVAYFIDTVQKHMGLDRVAFLLRSDEEEPEGGHAYYIHSYRGVPEDVANRFQVRNGLISWFQEKRQVFVRDEVEFEMEQKGFGKLYGQMNLIGAELLVPVFTKDKLAGILALDRKQDKRNYSQQDIDILNILAAEVGIAIENARLYGEAITDSLTGMFNRRYFEYRLKEELLRAQRYHRALSLLMIDVDRFKQINDTHGHPAGDFILKQIARVIRAGVRQIDIVCRYGGEEIAVILPEIGENVVVGKERDMFSIDACRTVAERIRRNIEQHEMWFGRQKMSVTVSIGMVYYSDFSSDMVTMTEIVGNADRALYQAKEAGRNCVKGFI